MVIDGIAAISVHRAFALNVSCSLDCSRSAMQSRQL
jgi:hypothetical protein